MPFAALVVVVMVVNWMLIGVRPAGPSISTARLPAPRVVMSPVATVKVPVLFVAWKARWPESGAMSRSTKVIALLLASRKTPVPAELLAFAFPKLMFVVVLFATDMPVAAEFRAVVVGLVKAVPLTSMRLTAL